MIEMEKWQEVIGQITDNINEPAALTALFTQANDHFGQNLAELMEAQRTIEELQGTIAKQQKYNMELFLRDAERSREQYSQGRQQEEKPRAETIKISDLFKEEK